jgi:DNA topoisomerase-1
MLETNFKQIMDINFTAAMEDKLELVASNEKDWIELIKEFWKEFIPTVETAEKEAFVPKVTTDINCPKCGAKLHKIWAGNKYFYGCSVYPECDFTTTIAALSFNKEDYADGFDWEQKCPLCKLEMTIRHGRFGTFLGCSKYPECKGIVNIPKKGETILSPEELPSCPAIGCDGRISARKSRFGKIFFSCSNFPDCNVIVNDIEELPTKYINYPKTAYEKKKKKSKKKVSKKKTVSKVKKESSKKPRIMSPITLTAELGAIVGAMEMPRNLVMKKVWEYIKLHNLQDPNNKRSVVPDEKLSQVLGSLDAVDMFKMTGFISKHMKK